MTLTLKIITDAYREGNLIAIGKEPTAPQVTEGLDRLKPLVLGVFGFEVGEQFMDWRIGNEGTTNEDMIWDSQRWAYPPANTRLIADSAEAQTIWLLPDPSDGARMQVVDPNNRLAAAPITLHGNGRGIDGGESVVISTSGTTAIYFYRADRGEWVLLTDLAGEVDEEFPFPQEFDDYFITRLAMRLNPRYGRSMAEASLVWMNDVQSRIRARYRQTVPTLGPLGAAALTSGYGNNRLGGGSYGDRGMSPYPRWAV